MRKLLKSWVFWAFVVPLVLAVGVWGIRREKRLSRCECGSYLYKTTWWLGAGLSPGVEVGPSWFTEFPSELYKEALDGAHAHKWTSSTGTLRALVGTLEEWGANSDGSDLSSCYLSTPPFREWLRMMLVAGELTPVDVERELVRRRMRLTCFPFGYEPPPGTVLMYHSCERHRPVRLGKPRHG